MRLKKQKRHRRAVRFFTACFGFRQPFKVLCDGTFMYNLHTNRIAPADTAVSNILGGTVKLFTTSCVIAELKRLSDESRKKGKESGDDPYTKCLKDAHKLVIARCGHEKVINAAKCITEVIGEKNSDHFFVATQDTDLRKTFQQVPGVPLIFGLRNALLMEQPSAFQRQFVSSTEEQRLHMTEREYELLNKRIKKGLNKEDGTDGEEDDTDANDDSGDENLRNPALGKTKLAINRSTARDRPQFKRKRAKGPNPLSCKKRKSQQQPKSTSANENKASDTTVRSRSRKRKRSRKGKSVAETDS